MLRRECGDKITGLLSFLKLYVSPSLCTGHHLRTRLHHHLYPASRDNKQEVTNKQQTWIVDLLQRNYRYWPCHVFTWSRWSIVPGKCGRWWQLGYLVTHERWKQVHIFKLKAIFNLRTCEIALNIFMTGVKELNRILT